MMAEELEDAKSKTMLMAMLILLNGMNIRRRVLFRTAEASKMLLTKNNFTKIVLEIARRETRIDRLVKMKRMLDELEMKDYERVCGKYKMLHNSVIDAIGKRGKTDVYLNTVIGAS
jgi:hypothetical protein